MIPIRTIAQRPKALSQTGGKLQTRLHRYNRLCEHANKFIMMPSSFADTHYRVQTFLPSASKFGFFLDATRFVNSFAAPTPARPRPPTVLRNAVYLWGITLSQDPQYTARESVFLGRTLRSVHAALSTAQEQQRNALYILQAEILLTYYFFHSDRPLEGKFHASAAVSLAIMCNLHKVMSGNGRAGGQLFQPAGQAYLPPPIDHIDEAERIFAWWAVFILDRSWAVALSSPTMINETQEPSTVIDTPWPLTVDKYAQVSCCTSSLRLFQFFYQASY